MKCGLKYMKQMETRNIRYVWQERGCAVLVYSMTLSVFVTAFACWIGCESLVLVLFPLVAMTMIVVDICIGYIEARRVCKNQGDDADD